MVKSCIICNEKIQEEYGKLKGSIVKATNEIKKNYFIYVCSKCQKKDKWVEQAKIRGV